MPHFATLKFRHMALRGIAHTMRHTGSASHSPRVTQAARHSTPRHSVPRHSHALRTAPDSRVTHLRHSLRDTALLLLFWDTTQDTQSHSKPECL